MAVPAAQQNAFNADKPLVAARNNLEDYNNVPEWRNDGDDRWSSGSDAVATGFDTDVVYDGFADPGRHTKPTAAAVGSRSLLLDLQTSVGGASVLTDLGIINGHNLSECGGTVDAFLEFDENDANTFADPRIAYEWTSIADNERLVGYNLGETASYVAAFAQLTKRYWRFRVTSSTNFAGAEPQVSEITLSTRHQLSQQGNQPLRTYGLRSEILKSTGKAGAGTVYEFFEGQSVIPVAWSFGDYADDSMYGLNEGSTILDWYRNSGGGTKPHYYVPNPSTVPKRAFFVRMADPVLNFDESHGTIIAFKTALVEEAGFVDSEQNTYR